MINDNKYVGFEKAGTPVIKSVGANNVDVYIDENGEYEAKAPFTGFGKVIVNTPNEAPVGWIPRDVVNGKLEKATRQINFRGINEIGERVLQYSYYGVIFPENTTIDMSSITQIGNRACYWMFQNSEGIKTVNLSKLKTINENGCDNMFSFSKDVENIDLSSLEKIERNGCNYMFAGCSKIKTVNLSLLKEATVNSCFGMFDVCSNLESVDLSNLTKIEGSSGFGYAFRNSKLTELLFPALKSITNNSFNNMLNGVTGCTVHFPTDRQSAWEVLSDFVNGFGGTDTVILFDLPAVG